MQSYLLLTLSMWKSLHDTYTDEKQGVIDLLLALILLSYSVSAVLFSFKFLRKNRENLSK